MLPLVSIRVFISFLLYEDIVERDLDASLELRESILSLPRSISSLSLDRTNISLQKKIFLKSDELPGCLPGYLKLLRSTSTIIIFVAP